MPPLTANALAMPPPAGEAHAQRGFEDAALRRFTRALNVIRDMSMTL
jgi:hypothetical protein